MVPEIRRGVLSAEAGYKDEDDETEQKELKVFFTIYCLYFIR